MLLKRGPKFGRHSFLSVIVIFHNMRREAARTLFALSSRYQRNINTDAYEIIAIDNGSTVPLDTEFVKSLGENFRYTYFNTECSSPCTALNYGAQIAKG